MFRNLIVNDIRKNKLISITIAAFITVAAALTSVAVMLGVNMFGAIDNMLSAAKTMDFLQSLRSRTPAWRSFKCCLSSILRERRL